MSFQVLSTESPLSGSSERLVRELFTHGGSGTLIRQGEAIRTFTTKTRLDRDKTTDLVQTAFGRSMLVTDRTFSKRSATPSSSAAIITLRTNGERGE